MLGLWKMGLVRALHLSPLKFSCPVNSDSRTSFVGTTFKAWFWRFFFFVWGTAWYFLTCFSMRFIGFYQHWISLHAVLLHGQQTFELSRPRSCFRRDVFLWGEWVQILAKGKGESICPSRWVHIMTRTNKICAQKSLSFGVYWVSFQRIWGICCCLIFVLVTFAFCRDGWICCYCWLQADENEKSWRYKNVGAPDSHACSCPRLCGGSNDCWWVIFQFLLPNCNQFFICDLWFEPEIIIL